MAATYAESHSSCPNAAVPLSTVQTALDHGRYALAFQPVMQAGSVEKPAFYEALIRIFNTQGDVIPAKDFMEMADPHPVGRALDCAALDLGLRELAAEPSLRLSINMSARTIGHGPWSDCLARGLALDPTVAERLIVEITETSAMENPTAVAQFMAELRLKGVSFALDDFGAGYTAFRHLRDFRFDMVKVDGDFSRDVHRHRDNQALVRALVGLAAHFDMFTVCEAVETQDEATFLANAGVHGLQGFHFAQPTLSPPWRAAPATCAIA